MNNILLTGEGLNMGIILVYLVVIMVVFWLMGRPQKKEQKRLKELISQLAVGDTVKTTAGFYGVVIDITDEMVIVEFGNNKNCRIPMDKASIVDVEKPDQE